MELKEVLRFADERVFAKTGQHLDDLQEAILKEALQGRKYAKIAQDRDCTEGYVRVAASELWKILSEVLDEEVSKGNVRAILERARFSYSSAIGQNYGTVNNVNFCQEKSRSPKSPQPPQQTPKQPQINLGDAPEIFSFYDRTTELATLEHWIISDRCRLIELLGMSGIGKTALTLRLIEQIKTNFDYVIYYSLCFSPTLETTLSNLLQNFCETPEINHNIEKQLSQLLNYLRNYRCLIILDDVQMLFRSGKFAGEYQPTLENYPLFFRRLAKTSHHSCLMLISSEKIRDFAKSERSNSPDRSLVLSNLGIAAKEILREHNLLDEETWETLINTYQGNPLWLEFTALMIQELFAGKVSEFLQCESLILCESLQVQLKGQYERLAPSEKEIIIDLAQEDAPITLSQIINSNKLATSDLLNAIQSLGRRLLLDSKSEGKQTYFQLNYLMKKYLQEGYPG